MAAATRVVLALGSGGARGYAHIGVIEVLEERGYEIVGVAGTSMGALVGGLHAAGRLEPYTRWVRSLTQRDVLRLLDPSLKAPGAIRADKILAKVTELVDGARIEQLPVPFTAVATDLIARKEVWLREGPVDAAIRASISLPPVIAPVMVNGRLLVDGGLMNPVPVVATAGTPADVTIAVALSDDDGGPQGAATVEETSEPRPMEEWFERSRRTAAGMLDSDVMRTLASWLTGGSASSAVGDDAGDVEERIVAALPAGLRTLDVMQLSLTALQSVVARFRLAGYPPDLMITIPKVSCHTLDFHRANEMIALGRERTAEALDRGPLIRSG